MSTFLNRLSTISKAALVAAGAMMLNTTNAVADPSPEAKEPKEFARALDAVLAGHARHIRIELDGYVPPTNWLPQILGGRAIIDARITPESYAVDSRVTAAGILDWFVDYSSTLNSRGKITGNGVKPVYYQALDDEGRKNRMTKITYRPDHVDVDVEPPYGNWGDPPASPEQKLESVDPMTALVLMAMNAQATPEDPCQGTVPIFDGKGRYNLHMSLHRHVNKLDAKGWKGPAFICNVKYEEVAGYKKKTQEEKDAIQRDLKWINIILADLGPGEPRVPIKIEARSQKRGKITLVVRRFSSEPLSLDRANADIPDNQG